MACAQVNERLKNVCFNTASSTRDVMKEKHKDVLTEKVVVQDRAKAEALFMSVMFGLGITHNMCVLCTLSE